MSDIFREVDEEIRQQQIIDFVKRYGKYVAAAAVLAIIVFAAVRYFDQQDRLEREATGERFAAAMSLMVDEKVADAIAEFAVIAEENGDDGYGLLARFRQAEALYETEEVQAAIGVYDAIADDGSVDSVWRNLAGVYAAMLTLEAASDADISDRLDELSGNHAWRLSVLELEGLNQFRQGDREGAQQSFRQLFEEAPDGTGFKARSAQMLSILGVSVSDLTTE